MHPGVQRWYSGPAPLTVHHRSLGNNSDAVAALLAATEHNRVDDDDLASYALNNELEIDD